MTKCIISDIDGTVADISHRRHYIQNKPKDWQSFFGTMEHDRPIEPLRQVLIAIMTNYPIVYVSGRPERHRATTIKWLNDHNFPRPTWIYLRKDHDYRADNIIKAEILVKIRLDGWDPIMVFEDRSRVVQMWRDNGILCAQIADGNF